ncbi:hypothetical protein [Peribacillus frigoritolerans]|uniref:hypothetical protein n=1 Tax=Peribacillus frigoritolerans TaxID=450367 RepID=UPI0025A0922A|nr:hypothetical protein [Peribacillus frigoritolerans]MDM5304009.1 hypothetical protein [Peribacillus frigoritolerans]MDM5309374.1 hypothetical protein [Peribacillus frigoritolerans]
MGNCSGHWNNWNKNDKGKFERNDHKSKKCEHKKSCESCGHDDKSVCDCNFKPVRRLRSPLNSDCVLVNSVVGSKMVQKVAEFTFPLTAFTPAPGIPITATILSVTVTPNPAGIVHNVRLIRDKVVNIGFVPVTISVTVAGIALPFTLTTSLPFQEHTDFPGACPEDTVTETPLVVEGIFSQPGVPVLGVTGLVTLTGILVKVVLRTTITVTRPVIMDPHGGICDVNERRCEDNGIPNFTLPTTPTTGGLLGGGA